MSEKVEMLQCKNKKDSNSISKSFDSNEKKNSKCLFHSVEMKCQIFLLFEVCNLIFASVMMHISYSRTKVCIIVYTVKLSKWNIFYCNVKCISLFCFLFLFVQSARRDQTHEFWYRLNHRFVFKEINFYHSNRGTNRIIAFDSSIKFNSFLPCYLKMWTFVELYIYWIKFWIFLIFFVFIHWSQQNVKQNSIKLTATKLILKFAICIQNNLKTQA